MRILFGVLFLALIPTHSAAEGVFFEFTLALSDRGFDAIAVDGCEWTRLSYTSTSTPWRAVVTDQGVEGIAGEFDEDAYLPSSGATFVTVIEGRGNRYTAFGLRSCLWLRLEFSAPAAGHGWSRLSHEGVTNRPLR